MNAGTLLVGALLGVTQISGQAARGGSQAPPASPAAAATDAATPAQSTPEVFALADRLVAEGRMQDAETLLEALTGDRALRYRSEARFRLGRLRVANGDLRGAIARYRALLDEEPGAVAVRLELARVYALANEEAAARRELRRASAIGLPDEVATAVDRFAGALRSRRRLGATIQVALAPDSNINRATSADEIGTVIGPLVPDRDARAKSGVGLALAGQAFWRGDDLLARLSARGDFYSRSRFNDMSVSAAFGPELRRGGARLRPAAVHARRWFGGSPYSQHYGASLNWLQPLTATSQVEVEASLL